MKSDNSPPYAKYVVIARFQSLGRRLLSNLPPLPPTVILAIQLAILRLVRVNERIAAQATEESTKDLVTIEEGDAFIDAGASVGGWSLWAASKVGESGIVLSLEPNPLAYAWLVRNTKGNPNIVALEVAAHSSNAVIQIWTVNNSMSSTVDEEVIGACMRGMTKGHFSPTRAMRLDSLASFLRPAQSIVVKIDVEGAEMAALRGATGFIHRIRIVMVEAHSESLRQEVVQFLSNHGFSIRSVPIGSPFRSHVIGMRLEVD